MAGTDEVWKGDALVRTYLDGVRGAIPLAAEQLDVMTRLVAATGRPVHRFADLGCGDGVLARTILGRYPDAAATLVDFSGPMLRQAAERMAAYGAVRIIEADLGSPTWVDRVTDRVPFDAVVSGYAIHHLPDARKRALYEEVYALLAPGGIFLNMEHVASGSRWGESLSDELMVDSLYAFHRQGDPQRGRAQVAQEFYHRPDKAANILAAVELQCEWLRAIGFADVDCFFKVFELAVFGGRKELPADTDARP